MRAVMREERLRRGAPSAKGRVTRREGRGKGFGTVRKGAGRDGADRGEEREEWLGL